MFGESPCINARVCSVTEIIYKFVKFVVLYKQLMDFSINLSVRSIVNGGRDGIMGEVGASAHLQWAPAANRPFFGDQINSRKLKGTIPYIWLYISCVYACSIYIYTIHTSASIIPL